jgi:hypothetical protein
VVLSWVYFPGNSCRKGQMEKLYNVKTGVTWLLVFKNQLFFLRAVVHFSRYGAVRSGSKNSLKRFSLNLFFICSSVQADGRNHLSAATFRENATSLHTQERQGDWLMHTVHFIHLDPFCRQKTRHLFISYVLCLHLNLSWRRYDTGYGTDNAVIVWKFYLCFGTRIRLGLILGTCNAKSRGKLRKEHTSWACFKF